MEEEKLRLKKLIEHWTEHNDEQSTRFKESAKKAFEMVLPWVAEEQAHQPEEVSWGASVRRDQAGFQRRACAGDDGAPGPREDGFRVSLLQLGAVGYSGGCTVAWAINLLRGIGGNVCDLGLRMEL